MPESYEWLQRRHSELLQIERSGDERQSDYLLSQANDFVLKLGEAGTETHDAERRRHLQEWLDHWNAFIKDRTGRDSSVTLGRPSIRWVPIVLAIILLLILVGLATILRTFFIQPSGPQVEILAQSSRPQVEILALGGGAVLPGDALAISSSTQAEATLQESGIGVGPPASSGLLVIDDFTVVRASADGRQVSLVDNVCEVCDANTNEAAIAIRAVAEDSRGIASLEVQISTEDGEAQAVRMAGSIPPAPPVTHYTQDLCLILNPVGSDAFNADSSYPLEPGSYAIKVIARNYDAVEGESGDIVLAVAGNGSSDNQAKMAVTSVEPCNAGLFPPFATTTVTPVPCYDDAAFVADVTVPDCTIFEPGVTFTKTWQLRNTGTCTWDTRYQLTFVEGAKMGAPGAVNVPHAVGPGNTVDISVPMVAPLQCGKYLSFWRMCNPDCVKWFGATFDAIIEVQKAEHTAEDLPAITRFEVEPNVISQGQQATLRWEYTNGTSARLDPGGQDVGPSGSQVVSPDHTITYRLVVINATGSVQRTTKLRVQPGHGPGPSPSPGPGTSSPSPSSPANLNITSVRSDGFDFTWTDTSVDEQGFRLYDADTRQALATFPANVTNGGISGLNCGRSYGLYLVSFNERGESLPSNTARASTSPCGG